MPISIAPPAAEEPEENQKPTTPAGPGLPSKPGLPSVPPKINAPVLSEGLDLDAGRDELDLLKGYNFKDELLNMDDYGQLSSLTSEDVIAKDYETYYARFEDKIVEVKAWLQEVLSEQNKSADIGEARKDRRSAKFKEMKDLLDQLLVRHLSQNTIVSPKDAPTLIAMVINEVLGLGPIEPLWQDPRITEIMVNGPYRTRIEIGGQLITAEGVRFRDSDHLLETCQQILAPLNRTIDIAHPFEDGRLNDGSRINITHPVIGPKGPYLTIRRFPETVFSMRTLVEFGALTEDMAMELAWLVNSAVSGLISGGTGSGKTSFLNALSGCIPENERIITIEDNLELRLHPRRDVLSLEARKSHQGEGKGNVTIRDLVRNSLRMRPDRIVIGEIRDATALDLLNAANTGHDGSLTTLHSSSVDGAIDRVVNLVLESGEYDSAQALSLLANGFDFIVQINRFEDGSRRVEEIAEIPQRLELEAGKTVLRPIPIWKFIQDGVDENNRIIGHYEKVNDYSESLIKKHRLNNRPKLSLEEVYRLSDQTDTGA
jgi:pilus assembly protein CpaF